MTENSPTLMDIHDRFDIYPRYPHTDHSLISNIAIESLGDTYRITTYPGGTGTMFDGFVIDMNTPNGIFEAATPDSVQTSRNQGGMLIFTAQDSIYEDGVITTTGTLSTPAAREGLILPGDDGFELFESLHEQVGSLKQPLQETLAVAGAEIEPVIFEYRANSGSSSYNHSAGTVRYKRLNSYRVGNGQQAVTVELDATVEVPMGERPDSQLFFQSGTMEQGAELSALSMEALLAFTGLQQTLQTLYR